jgi:hypothetical protein
MGIFAESFVTLDRSMAHAERGDGIAISPFSLSLPITAGHRRHRLQPCPPLGTAYE